MSFKEGRNGARPLAGLFNIMVLVLWLSCSAWAQTDQGLKEGDRAPNFSVTTDDGKRITPTNFGGNLLVLNFWETACLPCAKEMPSLTDFARKFRSEGVVVVAVSADEDVEKYRKFLNDRHVVLETYRDPSRRISHSFGTYMFPETYLTQMRAH